MGSYAQQITPSEDSRVVTGSNLTNYTETGGIGSGAQYQEAGSVSLGNSNTIKGTDLTSAQVGGNLTIGETGTANTFASAISKLFESNAANTAKLFELVTPATSTATTTTTEADTTAAVDWSALWAKWKKPMIAAGIGLALIIVFWKWRK